MAINSTFIPLKVGEKSSATDLAAYVGALYEIGGKIYRLVKFASAITDPENKPVVTAFSAGVPTYTVDTTTTAGNTAIAGVIPSTLTDNIVADDYALILVKGPGSVLSATTAMVDGDQLYTATTAGYAAELSVASTADVVSALKAVFGKCTATAGVTAAGLAVTALIDVPFN